jgi:hypothetical protein
VNIRGLIIVLCGLVLVLIVTVGIVGAALA